MRYPQVLVYENDRLLAGMLRETAKTNRWALREPRRPESCLRLLRHQCPTVLVLKIATHVRREPGLPIKEDEQRLRAESREREQIRSLELLDQVHWLHPDTAIVVVGDAEDASLTNLAWELGASFVLMPPQTRQQLPELVAAMMNERIRKQKPPAPPEPTPAVIPASDQDDLS
jgi:DNA-binding NarL/FixJ family response regulator